ncbi:MAG: DNA mismatch repair endonuclease MutL [Acidobacteria bacterium]|nr:MAG: DNA mismatch repair endonuclease MutL [Acidobacteriota bacterium]REK01210.1 MAG: DNA mismatch repair endonuclease MutL [Acidobacteriota bacterium]REK14166.1 MAG: DNA mismatch repair endonuclease MutL [Acidobacteriota bacterium]REK44881.1 MAG: DNA mismatch repair endonuclease MutL [Acidobacteriota bacterium]
MTDSKIQILPDHLSNQIAAGEVVERPASVVKELIENSLDAGARRIAIEIELGGRRLMQVSDDGEGMVPEDATLAFQRHATSKIRSEEDLAKIETLGFRGEALASIASVSKVELLTKVHDGPSATKIMVQGGKMDDPVESARPTGSTVTVRDLFFNTPARRKFMRSQATENFHITSIVTHYALANPSVAFTLKNNGRETLKTAPAKNLKERAFQIFGPRMTESLLPVDGGREFVARVFGFVSAPRERRTTRDAQYFFINGRFVKDRNISKGLQEAYRSVLPHGVYPVALLFLQIPFEEIDVNVHPAKTEVRFRRELAVRDVVTEAVREALADAGVRGASRQRDEQVTAAAAGTAENFRPPSEETETVRSAPEPVQDPIEFRIEADTSDFEKEAVDRAVPEDATAKDSTADLPESTRKLESDDASEPGVPIFDSAEAISQSLEPEDVRGAAVHPIGQLHESFILAQDDEGLLLIDQHVAHERILFDEFRQKEDGRRIRSQNLLVPETIDLTPAQLEIFSEVRDELEAAGFGVRELSGRTVAVQSVPSGLPSMDIENLLAELLDSADKAKRSGVRASFRDDIAASLACRAAVKINMKLSGEKMAWMVERLFTTSSPTTCPHGRPVILRLTMKDIERKFHRS